MKIFDITHPQLVYKSYDTAIRFLSLASKYQLKVLIVDPTNNYLYIFNKLHHKVVRSEKDLSKIDGYIPQVILFNNIDKASATMLNEIAKIMALYNPVIYAFEGKSSVSKKV